MTTKIHIGIVVLAAAFIASACVSTGEFEKMQAGKNEEIKTLQQQNTALEQQKTSLEELRAALEKQKAALEEQRASLEGQKSALEQKNMATQQQVGTLEQQKAALLAASQQRQQQYDALVLGLSKEVEKGQLQVRQYKDMLAVDLAEQIFFDSGRATLKAGGKDVLKKVGEALKGYENKIIRVVGHTDNVPLAKALQDTFPTNWELSVARATNVVRYLQEVGIPPERMVASGRSEYDPVATNDTPEGRQKNRRIEIMLIDKSLSDEIKKSTK
jgi:chemotaxis protein MotB